VTDLNKDSVSRDFFGVKIEGSIYEERPDTPQKPFSELKPYFDALWEKGVLAISWTQYTPWFNDGDTCEFNVHAPGFTTNHKVAEAWLNGDREWEDEAGDYQDASRYNYEAPWSDKYPHPDGLSKDDLELPIDHCEFEYAMLAKFGNHTEVVVTPTRVIQWEYSHD
jgi:hypothetical protein